MPQAKTAAFYLIKYITKDESELTNVLSIVKAADDHIAAHPSVAEDSGTTERTTIHLLTRLLNSLNGEHEYGGQNCFLGPLALPEQHLFAQLLVCAPRCGIGLAE